MFILIEKQFTSEQNSVIKSLFEQRTEKFWTKSELEAEYNKVSSERSSYKILIAQYNRICESPNILISPPPIGRITDQNNPLVSNVPELMQIDHIPSRNK